MGSGSKAESWIRAYSGNVKGPHLVYHELLNSLLISVSNNSQVLSVLKFEICTPKAAADGMLSLSFHDNGRKVITVVVFILLIVLAAHKRTYLQNADFIFFFSGNEKLEKINHILKALIDKKTGKCGEKEGHDNNNDNGSKDKQ
ncbi:hypothetical protein GQX74_002203 [Glossina fuscipes]|nr:hypothetical protein GQX74_002203 [Glossina fuscipes]